MTESGSYERLFRVYPGHRYTTCPEYRPHTDPITCYNCDNAEVDPGDPGGRWEPPEPPSCMCTVFDDDSRTDLMGEIADLYELGFTYENAARFCPLFRTTCENCGKPISSYGDVIPAGKYDPAPCCSETCKEVIEKYRSTVWYST